MRFVNHLGEISCIRVLVLNKELKNEIVSLIFFNKVGGVGKANSEISFKIK